MIGLQKRSVNSIRGLDRVVDLSNSNDILGLMMLMIKKKRFRETHAEKIAKPYLQLMLNLFHQYDCSTAVASHCKHLQRIKSSAFQESYRRKAIHCILCLKKENAKVSEFFSFSYLSKKTK